MDSYRLYNHTLKESELLDTIRNAARHGYASRIVINGEFYDIQVETALSACSACSDGSEDPDIPF